MAEARRGYHRSLPDIAGERVATVADLERWFGAPRPLSRPVPFWLLNGSGCLDRGELERQLGEFHRQGIQVVCLIPV